LHNFRFVFALGWEWATNQPEGTSFIYRYVWLYFLDGDEQFSLENVLRVDKLSWCFFTLSI